MFSKQAIEQYFNAEKKESLLFIGVGLSALLISLVFLFGIPGSFYKGAAIPFALVGALKSTAGQKSYYCWQEPDSICILSVISTMISGEDLVWHWLSCH